ncbi:flippase-like domain-containing protein, partial [bacterium]|nr:flippase-like domain-containing protein [bacterium]
IGLFYFYLKVLKKESFVKGFGKFFNHNLDTEPLEAEKEVFSFFKLENPSMWKTFLLSAFKAGAMYIRTLFLIIFLQRKIPLISTFSIFSFTYLAAMIPIPASLGTHEALQVFAFKSLGISQSVAAAFTLILRGADLLVALIGVVILIRLGLFLMKDNIIKRIINFNQKKQKR